MLEIDIRWNFRVFFLLCLAWSNYEIDTCKKTVLETMNGMKWKEKGMEKENEARVCIKDAVEIQLPRDLALRSHLRAA